MRHANEAVRAAWFQALAAASTLGGGTPSRLQQASGSTPATNPIPKPGPCLPLHACGRTLLGALLAELPACAWSTFKPYPSPASEVEAAVAQGRLSPAVAALDSEAARLFAVPAAEVLNPLSRTPGDSSDSQRRCRLTLSQRLVTGL